jgi:RNA polymerase sigma-70 factor (ECF subfamily)
MAALATDETSRALRSLAVEARRIWTGVAIDERAFVDYAAERIEGDDVAVLRPDLYLACALASGDPAALEVFEAELVPRVAGALRRGGLDADAVDDVMAVVRFRLLVDSDARPAKIRTFRGRSSLFRWLGVVATREARALIARERRAPVSDIDVATRAGSEVGDLESEYFAREHRRAFRAALERGLAELTSKERLLLRLDVLEGLSDAEIASIYRVHRTTALRWVDRATTRLVRAAKRHLAAELALRDSELDSVLRGVASHLDLSLGRLLAETPSP